MSMTKYRHPPNLPKTVSIGWLRDDGDFEVVCTLKCPHPRSGQAFESLVEAATAALEAASDLEMEVMVREDTDNTVTDHSKPDAMQQVYVYHHPKGVPKIVSFVCIDSLDLADGEYRLVGTLYGEDLFLPEEFDFVVNAIRTFLTFCLQLPVQILVRQDAPNVVEVES